MTSTIRAEATLAELPQLLGPSRAAIAALRAHPAFDRAMMIAAEGIIRHFAGNPILNRMMNDRGRVLFALGSLYLDAEPDASGRGLTAARLIEFAGVGKYASPGRAKATIALLRWGGYLEDGPPCEDRRQRPLVPTEKLWTIVLQRWRSLLQALAVLRPIGAEALVALDDPAVRASIAVTLGRAFRSGFRVLQNTPRLTALAERDAAMVMLFVVTGATLQKDEAPSISGLAGRFGVSRAHARGVLRDAELAGLLALEKASPGREPKTVLESEMAVFFATLLALFEHAATIAIATRMVRADVADAAG
ncbi:MAG TPA: hypothetical protein VNX29_21110 [Kaistia sp.]|nr:hypothetical protein [Kaistia sp.]